jgi:hypothetical protein
VTALFPANDTQSAYPPADVVMAYVTVIEAATMRRDRLLMLSHDWSHAEQAEHDAAEREIDAARIAIRDALGMTRGELVRLVRAAV